ncbi:acetyl-CoA carboxylase biotin carboxyl carrier protein [Polymorphobacter sp. PAMC 29334]|uniref:acetyl-CoA carboxylase biotin carboxyl carrier protein n=1 Tax=Polymorphobacter sp. PAMC 29334 TaxID=2862331 RepID=UPI001C78DC36|nr:acetyl-CoA carboxylase biotin carboxyl carrier protein [Polymorphobacter sp. PAMC 29334]QYE36500.1 acetyl-CoA carboxylase biotin carboxyl carrier protein [Polymorphobacter sp. PAMC 29334]
MTDSTGPMQVDTKLVRELAELLDSTRLTEIEVQDGERKIRVARTPAPVAAAPMYAQAPAATAAAPAAAVSAAPEAPAVDDVRKHPGLVRSPIVGTAYLTPDPASPPYVTVGATVKAGQTLLIIEAMKVMNPITAPKAGTVARILITNEQPVEYDEPLIVIE